MANTTVGSPLGPIELAILAKANGLPADAQKSLRAYQNQQSMAQALLQQGLAPLDTNNRTVGGMGYNISPWEGVSKIAQALTGAYGENQANDSLSSALAQAGNGAQGSSGKQDPIVAEMPADTQSLYHQLMLPEAFGGNPRAGIELYKEYSPAMHSYLTGVGTAGAQNAPVGTAAPGMPGYTQPQTAPIDNSQASGLSTQPSITPVDGPQQLQPIAIGSSRGVNTSALTDALSPQSNAAALAAVRGGAPIPPVDQQFANGGIPNPPTPSQIAAMPTPMPGESNAAYQARLEAAKAGATAQAQVEPSGNKVTADKNATNAVDADQGVAKALSLLVNTGSKISDMKTLANKTMSGYGVSDSDPTGNGMGWRLEMKNALGNQEASNTLKFKNLNDQLFLNEIPALTSAASSLRMDIPIVKGIKGASGIPLEASDKTGLIDQLGQNIGLTKQQLLNYYHHETGKDFDMGTVFSNPDSIKSAYKAGVLTQDEATNLLSKNHGFSQ